MKFAALCFIFIHLFYVNVLGSGIHQGQVTRGHMQI